jgi:hypothetical protein
MRVLLKTVYLWELSWHGKKFLLLLCPCSKVFLSTVFLKLNIFDDLILLIKIVKIILKMALCRLFQIFFITFINIFFDAE